MSDMEVPLVCEGLRACRACLATDVLLNDLRPGHLADTYAELTGLQVLPTDGLPQHLCTMCVALLKKSAAFRVKCRNTHEFLQRVGKRLRPLGQPLNEIEIPMSLIRDLDRKYLKLPYITTDVLTVSILEDITTVNKYELPVKQDQEDIEKVESEDDCVALEDCNDSYIMLEEKPIEQIKKEDIFTSPITNNDIPVPKLKKKVKKEEIFTSPIITNNDRAIPKLKGEHVEASMESEKKEDCPVYDERFRTENQNKVRESRTKSDIQFGKMYNFDVIRMTRNEQILELERRKNVQSYQRLTLKCEECFRAFSTETLYKKHMAVHDPISGSHVCEVCKQRFLTRVKLCRHKQKHRIKYVCRECMQTFRSSTKAREHWKDHTGDTYDCPQCDAKFKKCASRVNHIRIHHGATQCDICYEGFQGAKGVAQHKAKAHKQTYQCQSCDVHFDNARAMLRHIGISPGGACDPNVRACAKCGERFETDEQFDEHVAREHGKTREKPKEQKGQTQGPRIKTYSKCCTCPHLERDEHNGGREHKVSTSDLCPCRKVYGDDCLCPMGSVLSCKFTELDDSTNKADVFKRNKCAHKGCCKERRLMRSCAMCEICGTVFPGQTSLRWHQRIHTGEKPFQCNECPKRFRLKFSLQKHMYTHTGERPYKCLLCPKTFNSRGNRHRHNLVHTKERRHRCEVCDKMFQTSTCVKLHVRTVHMKIPPPPRVRNRKRNCE